MKRKSAFSGVVILTLALIAVKILSAIYRVPYQNVLGDAGLYAYQQVYPFLSLATILSMNAIPSAVTQNFGAHWTDKRISQVAIGIQTACFAIFLIVFSGASVIARIMGDMHLTPMIQMASCSFLVVGVLGVLRGSYQSRQQMELPAYSQVIEQIVRVGIILAMIVVFAVGHGTIYQIGKWSILASALGFLAASLFLIWKRPFRFQWQWRENDIESQVWKRLTAAIIIFSASHLIVTTWQLMDSFSVIRELQHYGLSFKESIVQKGIYDRGASFIQIGLIVTTTFCFVLIPLLTNAFREGRFERMNRYANASLKITVTISVAAGVGLMNLLPLMNRVFFKNDVLTATLVIYMLTVICVSLIMVNIALLEVRRQSRLILITFAAGALLKLVLNVLLIPRIGIIGASISTVLSLCLFAGVLQWRAFRFYRFRHLRTFVMKLIISMVGMTLAVQVVMWLLPTTERLSGMLELLVAAIAGVAVVVAAIIGLNLLTYKELQHMPFGDKLYHFKKGRKR
ncbi:polysaccharide biosynthesis protein [Staphylococcus carnosus]|uniref:Stage V sporulation protein B n=1 Tax=Staphylococcus carnosus TaxID=1281 RepID=A0AAJ0JM14_STACA|nr:polysaccharide biosynthesis protein [Staphylococcus carnosus]KKB24304.1 stage V sporulation protein B [Staphylococcus carnosus]POA03699.1 polysaccharide biosynthesis protein [Staphylococcus carnosus]QQS86142.1 polysaccharide biosynthesis protein [Staphylococcus carnosus]QRQ06077.1 polysaccharide biosynthesis protein [Staphylococcus carnosus]UTB81927.1 stage V sporulation protein B [Staphylococcus carnosus]